jgi:hypothetical protein
MSTDYVERSTSLIGCVPGLELAPHAVRPLAEGEPVQLERLDPPTAVVSALRPTGALADVRTATCHYGHFFSSPAAAARWADEHPDGYILGVNEAFRLDREVITQLGWHAALAQAR